MSRLRSCRSVWANRVSGVTLIELVIVIVITAILATMMTSFVFPFLLYADASRRAELTDIADTALRRMGRDLRAALPNSVRVTTSGGVQYVEFLALRSGGRYRADSGSSGGTACGADGSSDPNMLVFGSADACFKSLGDMPNSSDIVANNDFVVIYNLQPGTANADAYATGAATGGNKSLITAVVAETAQVSFTIQSNTFTYESPSQRFQVIEGPVTYACNTTAKTLRRYSGYSISSAQPAPPGGTSALLASGVSACNFSYDENVVAPSAGLGLVTLSMGVSSTGLNGNVETVNLYYAVHVSNVP